MAGVTFTHGLYAAAVDYIGVANLFAFMKTIPPYWKPYLTKMHEMVGDPEKDGELLNAASPAFHADKIKTPQFIAQGTNDPRVNKNEYDQMVDALRKRGVKVQYMVKDNEGHGFHNEENQFDFSVPGRNSSKNISGNKAISTNKTVMLFTFYQALRLSPERKEYYVLLVLPLFA